MARQRALMLGAGGFGGVWCREFLPALPGRVKVVALADLDAAALAQSGELLGIPASRRFADAETAIATVDADVAFAAIPPAARLRVVEAAAARGLPLLCEKPVAASWSDALAILELADRAGMRLAIVQNYREERRMRTLRRFLREGGLGALTSITVRFAADYTIDTAGGAFRHQVPHAMLYEGAVHHFDALRDLAAADGSWVAGTTWNTPWSTFANPPCGMFVVAMANGVVGQFEITHITRGHVNDWHREAYRVEGEHGAVTIDADGIVRHVRHQGEGRERVTELAPVDDGPVGHLRVIGDFLDWLEGGPVPASEIHDNIRTAALTFAAVEAARSRMVVDVPDPLAGRATPVPSAGA